ncbi:glycosyl hydrolase 5 family protein-like [Lolium perenne]|uniref:glycosyl hydrolase 5 family protein-like n=1 Tax=Lolium perenne TaxID=4522 RepID=UPI0021E9EE70|nr:glycosyl hydrolase 5 family protein-like [Lolium perenne]
MRAAGGQGPREVGEPNGVCARIGARVSSRALYLLDQGWPVILSDFGTDNRGGNVNDNHYYGCAAAVAADLDLDWALWMLQGSYYLREGVLDVRAAGRAADPAGQPDAVPPRQSVHHLPPPTHHLPLARG